MSNDYRPLSELGKELITAPTVPWKVIATDLFGRGPHASLIPIAVNRLESGDVSHTKFGIRVAVRKDLGDHRRGTKAEAYWPTSDGGCKCWQAKQHKGRCSHHLAAELLSRGGGMEGAVAIGRLGHFTLWRLSSGLYRTSFGLRPWSIASFVENNKTPFLAGDVEIFPAATEDERVALQTLKLLSR